MHKLIYKIFFAAGICASTLGINAASTPARVNTTLALLKPMVHNEKLYFSDAIQDIGDSSFYGAHYSHSSHASHSSHQSHYSHVSSR